MKTAADLLEKLDSDRLKRKVNPLDYSLTVSDLLPELIAVLRAAEALSYQVEKYGHDDVTFAPMMWGLNKELVNLNQKAQEASDAE